jgi:hypothetical protein
MKRTKSACFKLKAAILIFFVILAGGIYSQDITGPAGFKIYLPEQTGDNCISQSGYDVTCTL